MNFYTRYEDRDDDRLGKNNDNWKISFYNYYKRCDYCGEIFLKSGLIYVTTNTDEPENVVETLRLCGLCLTTINHKYYMNKCLIEEEHERDSIIVIYYIIQLDKIICLSI